MQNNWTAGDKGGLLYTVIIPGKHSQANLNRNPKSHIGIYYRSLVTGLLERIWILVERKIKNISDGIFIWPPGSCPRGGTWGYWREGGLGRSFFFPKFNQIWSVSYLHEWHMQRTILGVPAPWALGGGAKRANII